LATAILATSSVLAVPAFNADKRQQAVCTEGLYTTPLCCATDVLGIADLDCAAPNPTPSDNKDFINICAEVAGGQQAQCCLLPILGQALVCEGVV
ncbi:hydrophobin, partial [Mytilinidion resinicola]